MGSKGGIDHAHLNEDLLCKVCLGHYDAMLKPPKLLPCSHTYCHDCVEQLLLKTQKKCQKVYCPLCQKKVELKLEEELPKNYDVIDKLAKRSLREHAHRQNELLDEHDLIWGDPALPTPVSKVQHQPLHPPKDFNREMAVAPISVPDSSSLAASLQAVNGDMMTAARIPSSSSLAAEIETRSVGSMDSLSSHNRTDQHQPSGDHTMDHQTHASPNHEENDQPQISNDHTKNHQTAMNQLNHDQPSHNQTENPRSVQLGQPLLLNGFLQTDEDEEENKTKPPPPPVQSSISRSDSTADSEDFSDWNYFSSKSTIGRASTSSASHPSPSNEPKSPQPQQQQPQQPGTTAQIFDENAILKIYASPSDKLAVCERGKMEVKVFGKDGKMIIKFASSHGRSACFVDDKTFAIAVNEGVELYDAESGKFKSIIPVKKPLDVAAVKGGFVTTVGTNLSMCLFANGKIAPYSVACVKKADGSFHFFKNVRALSTARFNPNLIVILDADDVIFVDYSGNVVSIFSAEYFKSVGVTRVEAVELNNSGKILVVYDSTANAIHAFDVTTTPPVHALIPVDPASAAVTSFAINSADQILVASRDAYGPSIKRYPIYGGGAGGRTTQPSVASSKVDLFQSSPPPQHQPHPHHPHPHQNDERRSPVSYSGEGDEELREKLMEKSGVAPEVYVKASQATRLDAIPTTDKLHYIETLTYNLKNADKVKLASPNGYLCIDAASSTVRLLTSEGREFKTFKVDNGENISDACCCGDNNHLLIATRRSINFHNTTDTRVIKQLQLDGAICVEKFGGGFVASDGKKVLVCRETGDQVEVNMIGRANLPDGRTLAFKQILDVAAADTKSWICMLGQGGVVVVDSSATAISIHLADKLRASGLATPAKRVQFSADGLSLFVMDSRGRIFSMPSDDSDGGVTYLPFDGRRDDVRNFYVTDRNEICVVCAEAGQNVIHVYSLDALYI